MKLRLKEIREDNELKQSEVAVLLKVSRSNYNYFETGERIIPLKHLNAFCNHFNVSMDYVLGLSKHNIVSKQVMELDKVLVGQRIREVRKMRKLTQEKLADIVHTTQSTISSYEKGTTLILTAFLYEMCKRLKVSSDYLTGRSNVIKIMID